jgi:hypothetical protein
VKAQPETGSQPAPIEVGEDPEELIEQKQAGNLKAGKAELVEMEQHQHAQSAIAQGESPVGAGDHHVLLQGREGAHGVASHLQGSMANR